MSDNTHLILEGLVKSGDLKSFELETIEEHYDSRVGEHDRLTLYLPSGKEIVIDVACNRRTDNLTIFLDGDMGGKRACACVCHKGTIECFGICPCIENH